MQKFATKSKHRNEIGMHDDSEVHMKIIRIYVFSGLSLISMGEGKMLGYYIQGIPDFRRPLTLSERRLVLMFSPMSEWPHGILWSSTPVTFYETWNLLLLGVGGCPLKQWIN